MGHGSRGAAPSCPACGCTDLAVDLGSKICEACGLVLEENMVEMRLPQDRENGEIIGTSVGQNDGMTPVRRPGQYQARAPYSARQVTDKGKRLQKKMYNWVRDTVNRLHLSRAAGDRMKLYVDQLLRAEFRPCNTATVAALGYVVCREQGTSITLIEVADAWQLNLFLVGRMYKRLRHRFRLALPEIEPSIFIRRACNNLHLDQHEQRVAQAAVDVVALCDSLQTGRRPVSITGAAIICAGDAEGLDIPVDQVAQVLHITGDVLRCRVKEVRAALIDLCKSLPIASQLNEKTFKRYAKFLVHNAKKLYALKKQKRQGQLEVVVGEAENPDGQGESMGGEVEPQADSSKLVPISPDAGQGTKRKSRSNPINPDIPPSFTRGQRQRAKRAAKVAAAQHRIALESEGSGNADSAGTELVSVPVKRPRLDPEDHRIEDYLRHGVQPAVLEDGHYLVAQSQMRDYPLPADGPELTSADLDDSQLHLYLKPGYATSTLGTTAVIPAGEDQE